MGHDEDLTYLVHSTPIAGSQSSQRAFSREDINVDALERLLSAIDRIRAERDDLKRQLEFSQMEYKFAVEARETKGVATSSAESSQKPATVEKQLKAQDVVIHAQTGNKLVFHQNQVKRWGLALAASSIVIGRLTSKLDCVSGHLANAVQANKDLLSQAEGKIHMLEAELVRTNTTLSEVEQQRVELLSRVGIMEGMLGQSGHEALAEREVLQHSREELAQMQSQFADLTKVLSDVETERDSLNLRVQHLETDLDSVQQELTDAQIRYSSLQAQKLSSMTSNAATRALKQQIEELEGRVMRRTEQIGVHQHDIMRLETNLRLHEERITEMTVELETLSTQKEAMVEDCAEAREARDLALRQMEAMEMKVEAAEDRTLTLEHDRAREVASLVCVVADTVTRARETVLRMKNCLYVQSENHTRLSKRPRLANGVEDLNAGRSGLSESEAARMINDLQKCIRGKAEEAQQAILALAISQKACGNHTRSLEHMAISKIQMEAKIHEQHEAVVQATSEISSLQYQLRQDSREEQPDLRLEYRIADLEDQIQNLHRTASEAESRHKRAVAELTWRNEELRVRTEHEPERIQAEEELRKEIHTLNAMHAEEVRLLHGRLDKATAEFAQLQREQGVREDEYQKLQRELDHMSDNLRSRISEVAEQLRAKTLLESRFAQAESDHQDRIDRLQKDLDAALQNSEENSRTGAELKCQHDAAVKNLLHVQEGIKARLYEVQAECATLQRRLDEEIDGRDQDRRVYQDELRCAVEHSHNTEAGLHQEIVTLRVDLERSQEALRSMTEEKNGLEAEMTNFEAEIQRSISLCHYLEKQVKEGCVVRYSVPDLNF
jgi:chromosome segregation ATPase